MSIYHTGVGRGSSVGIATELQSRHSGDRIPVGAIFCETVYIGPGAHPASCKVGTGSSPGVKRPGRGVNHTPASTAEVKERI
jgi:hypothetical protein